MICHFFGWMKSPKLSSVVMMAGLLTSLFYSRDLWAEQSSAADNQKHYVSDATIYDSKMKPIKKFLGMGAFFDDGSFILARQEKKWLITRFSALGDKIWEREIYAHHQLNLSPDKKRLLVISGEVRTEARHKRSYDTFLVLEIKTGKTLVKSNSFDFFTVRSKIFSEKFFFPDHSYMKTEGSPVHFNSFYEIPENPSEKLRPEFKKGNYIVNDAFRPAFVILDKNLKVVLEEKPFTDSSRGGFHDVQVLPDGKILFYRGEHIENAEQNQKRSAVFKYDPIARKLEMIFPEDLKTPGGSGAYTGFSEAKGSAQETTDGFLICHNDSLQGGMIILTDKTGRLVKKMFNPESDRASGKPASLQQIKQFDLTKFLKNNKM